MHTNYLYMKQIGKQNFPFWWLCLKDVASPCCSANKFGCQFQLVDLKCFIWFLFFHWSTRENSLVICDWTCTNLCLAACSPSGERNSHMNVTGVIRKCWKEPKLCRRYQNLIFVSEDWIHFYPKEVHVLIFLLHGSSPSPRACSSLVAPLTGSWYITLLITENQADVCVHFTWSTYCWLLSGIIILSL